MDFNREVLDFHYHNVLNGFSPFIYNECVYFAKHLTSKETFDANAHLLLTREQYKSNGLATEYEMIKDAINRGVWSKSNEDEIISITKNIERKNELLPNLQMPSQVKQLKSEIVILQRTLIEKETEKAALLSHCLEHKILMEKRDYLGYLGVHIQPNVRLWATFDDFMSEGANLVNKLINEYFHTIREITPEILRAVARSTDARYKMKNCSLKSIDNISINFLELKQWCDFYNSIYELPDRPDELVVQNDAKLDAWLIARKAKSQVDKSVNNTEGGFTGIVGGTKEDMEAFEGTDRDTVINLAKTQNG